VERKNRALEELVKTLLNETDLRKYFWADGVSTSCYVLNRVLIRPILKKTPYELFKGRKSNIFHLNVFGCKCFMLNIGKDNLGKFDSKANDTNRKMVLYVGYGTDIDVGRRKSWTHNVSCATGVICMSLRRLKIEIDIIYPTKITELQCKMWILRRLKLD